MLLVLTCSRLALSAAASPATPRSNPQPTSAAAAVTFRVYGYDEGLVGSSTANGHVIESNDHFVALPCFCVLSSLGGSEFQVKITYNGTSVTAPVWDVGPWNVDDNYWDPPEQRRWPDLPQGLPEAQAAYENDYNNGQDGWDRQVSSPGGIDIGDGTFADLGMTGSDWVDVTFLWLQPAQQRFDLPPLPDHWGDIPTVWEDERPPLDSAGPISDGRYGYVWETGHNVPDEILDYWYANGGWRTFGLPLSEFYREVHYDGTIRYVQIFERSILSLDLSGDTSPPLVIGDLLGYTTYINPEAAQPVEPFDNWASATYFPATGHSLQNGFKAYWESHGGLYVFGYPLSEEWSYTNEDGRKVVMQVFERARFEWWPDMVGTDAEITLGLLARELMIDKGWLDE